MKYRAIPIFTALALLFGGEPYGFGQAPAAPAPASVGSQADQMLQQGVELMNAGKTQDAANVFNSILSRFSNSGAVPEATYRLGYAQYVLGQYSAAMTTLGGLKSPPAPPGIKAAADALLPQILATQADKLAPTDPQRKAGFENAIQQFDAYVKKYPQSPDVETAYYGRAVAAFQIQDYDEAAKSLRTNLQRFSSSPSLLDNEYLLGVVLLTQGIDILHTHGDPAAANAKFTDALGSLAYVVRMGTDVVLANNAQFQIGEVLFNRATTQQGAERDKTLENAVRAYQAVQPKEAMLQAQKARIASVLQQIQAAVMAHNPGAREALQRLMDRENTKLEALNSTPDQTMNAYLRVVGCYVTMQKFDEARTLLHYMEPFVQDEALKKQVLYYTTLTYASQGLMDQAVAGYDQFMSKYHGDPLGENLPVALGTGFLMGKTKQPDKAVHYFDDEAQLYPNSPLIAQALSTEASALMALNRFGDALSSYQRYLKTNPPKEQAAGAQEGIAVVYQQTGKVPDAIKQFEMVATNYPGTPNAEESAYYASLLKLASGDPKGGLADLQDFVKKFPAGKETPEATFRIAQAQAATGDKAGALLTYKDIIAKYPQTDFGPQAYFQEAVILGGDKKTDEMLKVMRDFIAAYPDNKYIFNAYDTIGQTQSSQGKIADAAATYAEMAEKHPADPQAPMALYRVAELWRKQAESEGHYVALSDQQRKDWNKSIASSLEAGEKTLQQFPESEAAGLALKTLLDDQRLLVDSKQKTSDDVQKYFQDLASKFSSDASAKSRILFTLATYTYEKDKARALSQMTAAYNPSLTYAPADLDLYGGALIDQGKAADAYAIYQKIMNDYPVPPGQNPAQAQPAIQEAQATAIYGMANSLQKQGQTDQAAKLFTQLKATYPWSSKVIEANYGIAQSLLQQNKIEEAMALLRSVANARTATADLRASALLTIAQTYEKQNNVTAAIDSYLEIATYYQGVPDAASEGLWKGGQLLEQQATMLNEQSTPKKSDQLGKAKGAYQQLNDQYPDSKYAPQAKQRLDALK